MLRPVPHVAILSPHPDDAVLSCWHVLSRPGEVAVLNVFTGRPEAGSTGHWDRLTGARDSRARIEERLHEDRQALALAGREPVNLDFLDNQYRAGGQALEPLEESLARLLAAGTLVYAPAALGDHPDHALVRAAALRLRQRGLDVLLYADLPHAIAQRGWPAWVTGGRADGRGTSPDRGRDAAASWDRALADAGLVPGDLAPQVVALDPAARARKAEAVTAYATQVAALEQLLGLSLSDPEALGYEVAWSIDGVKEAGER